MTTYDLHQAIYTPEGDYIGSTDNTWIAIKWWFDAVWDVAFPADTTGKIYLDMACAEGLYPLRFAQRGGRALGINPESPYQTYATSKLKGLYSEVDFHVIDGGFIKGVISPEQPPYDYVSCMNCLEYLDEPRIAVESMFKVAKKQVAVSTDIWLGKPLDVSDGRCLPLRQKFIPEEFISWCPWPTVVYTLDYLHCNAPHDQGFFISRENGDFSDLPRTIAPYVPNGRFPTQARHVRTITKL